MKRFLKTAFGATAVWILALAAQAATIVVDTALDVVAEDGLCSLREAIINANTNGPSGSTDCVAGDFDSNTIVFDPSLAHATITLNGEQLPSLARVLTIEGPVPGDSSGITLHGDQASRLIRMLGTGVESTKATLRDLTLTGGRTTETGGTHYGGAAWVANASLILERVVVSHNSTAGNSSRGGGLYGRQARIELIDSVVEHNHTEGTGSPGGGILAAESELILLRTQVLANRTLGGGVSRGGGVWAGPYLTTAGGSEVTIIDSVIAGNAVEASANFGGGLFLENGQAFIYGSTIVGNFSTASGGGVEISGGELELVNSTVTDNACGSGGCGLALRRATGTVLHSTVAFNTAASTGARGIALIGTASEPANLELVNSLVVQEASGQATCSTNQGTITSVGSFSSHASCTGEATAPEDINLAPLADNGGPTPTHALFPGSVAIEAAGNCGSDFDVALDQRGLPRPGGDSTGCDTGAFEQQESPLEADLQVGLSVSPAEAAAGETVTFYLEVLNTGPEAAENASALFDLPDGYEFVSANPNLGSYDSITGVWTMGVLASSVVMTLHLEATLNADGDRVAVVTAGSDTFDPDVSNNTDQAVVTLLLPTGPMVVDTLLDVVADDGLCSLREAIINANNGDQSGSADCMVGDLVLFDAALIGGTIALNGTQLPTISVDLAIEGPAPGDPAGMTLDAVNQSRVLEIDGDISVQVQDITLTGGRLTAHEQRGGALLADGAHIELTGVRITGNVTEGNNGFGGGVAMVGGTLFMVESDLSGNSTTGPNAAGGGLYVSDSQVLVMRSTVSGNEAAHVGGGMRISSSEVDLINSTVSGNATSGGGGGGIYVAGGTLTSIHSTVAMNTAASGNGHELFIFGNEAGPATGHLENSLVVSKGTFACGSSADHATIASTNSMSTSASCTGTATPLEDIRLAPLADNGGAAPTHALLVGSTAINAAGDCGMEHGIDTDQRGQPRPGGTSGACDVGAYEFQGQGEDLIFSDHFESSN